jgi:hypothetical protein
MTLNVAFSLWLVNNLILRANGCYKSYSGPATSLNPAVSIYACVCDISDMSVLSLFILRVLNHEIPVWGTIASWFRSCTSSQLHRNTPLKAVRSCASTFDNTLHKSHTHEKSELTYISRLYVNLRCAHSSSRTCLEQVVRACVIY